MTRNLDYIINLVDGTFRRGMGDAQQQASGLDSKFKNLARSAAAFFSIRALYNVGKEATDLNMKLEAMDIRMQAASRTAQRFDANNSFLHDTISALKLPLMETTEGYTKFLGGVRGTSIEGDKANQVFKNMSIGIKALKLGPEEAGRVFNALGKMVSTGTVQADEFKGQLAEAMPGAVELGAKAMGMSMQKFYKEMEKGNINSAQFVQLFSNQLVKEYGSTIPHALESMQSKAIEADNALMNTKRTLGEALAPTVANVLGAVTSLADATSRLIAGQTPLADKLRATQMQLNAEFEVLKKGNVSMGQRKTLIDQINTAAGPYLSHLLTEKSTIQDITKAQNEMNTALQQKIAVQAKSEIESDILKDAVNAQKSAMQFRVEAEKYRSGVYGGDKDFRERQFRLHSATAAKSEQIAVDAQKELRNIDNILNQTLKGMGITTPTTVADGAPWPPNPFAKGQGAEGTGVTGNGLINSNTTSVAAGRSVRNVNVDIQNLVGEFNVHTTNIKEGAQDTKKIVQDALVRSVLDAEAAL